MRVVEASILEDQIADITMSNYDVSCYSIGHRLRHEKKLPTSNASRVTNALGPSFRSELQIVFRCHVRLEHLTVSCLCSKSNVWL